MKKHISVTRRPMTKLIQLLQDPSGKMVSILRDRLLSGTVAIKEIIDQLIQQFKHNGTVWISGSTVSMAIDAELNHHRKSSMVPITSPRDWDICILFSNNDSPETRATHCQLVDDILTPYQFTRVSKIYIEDLNWALRTVIIGENHELDIKLVWPNASKSAFIHNALWVNANNLLSPKPGAIKIGSQPPHLEELSIFCLHHRFLLCRSPHTVSNGLYRFLKYPGWRQATPGMEPLFQKQFIRNFTQYNSFSDQQNPYIKLSNYLNEEKKYCTPNQFTTLWNYLWQLSITSLQWKDKQDCQHRVLFLLHYITKHDKIPWDTMKTIHTKVLTDQDAWTTFKPRMIHFLESHTYASHELTMCNHFLQQYYDVLHWMSLINQNSPLHHEHFLPIVTQSTFLLNQSITKTTSVSPIPLSPSPNLLEFITMGLEQLAVSYLNAQEKIKPLNTVIKKALSLSRSGATAYNRLQLVSHYLVRLKTNGSNQFYEQFENQRANCPKYHDLFQRYHDLFEFESTIRQHGNRVCMRRLLIHWKHYTSHHQQQRLLQQQRQIRQRQQKHLQLQIQQFQTKWQRLKLRPTFSSWKAVTIQHKSSRLRQEYLLPRIQHFQTQWQQNHLKHLLREWKSVTYEQYIQHSEQRHMAIAEFDTQKSVAHAHLHALLQHPVSIETLEPLSTLASQLKHHIEQLTLHPANTNHYVEWHENDILAQLQPMITDVRDCIVDTIAQRIPYDLDILTTITPLMDECLRCFPTPEVKILHAYVTLHYLSRCIMPIRQKRTVVKNIRSTIRPIDKTQLESSDKQLLKSVHQGLEWHHSRDSSVPLSTSGLWQLISFETATPETLQKLDSKQVPETINPLSRAEILIKITLLVEQCNNPQSVPNATDHLQNAVILASKLQKFEKQYIQVWIESLLLKPIQVSITAIQNQLLIAQTRSFSFNPLVIKPLLNHGTSLQSELPSWISKSKLQDIDQNLSKFKGMSAYFELIQLLPVTKDTAPSILPKASLCLEHLYNIPITETPALLTMVGESLLFYAYSSGFSSELVWQGNRYISAHSRHTALQNKPRLQTTLHHYFKNLPQIIPSSELRDETFNQSFRALQLYATIFDPRYQELFGKRRFSELLDYKETLQTLFISISTLKFSNCHTPPVQLYRLLLLNLSQSTGIKRSLELDSFELYYCQNLIQSGLQLVQQFSDIPQRNQEQWHTTIANELPLSQLLPAYIQLLLSIAKNQYHYVFFEMAMRLTHESSQWVERGIQEILLQSWADTMQATFNGLRLESGIGQKIKGCLKLAYKLTCHKKTTGSLIQDFSTNWQLYIQWFSDSYLTLELGMPVIQEYINWCHNLSDGNKMLQFSLPLITTELLLLLKAYINQQVEQLPLDIDKGPIKQEIIQCNYTLAKLNDTFRENLSAIEFAEVLLLPDESSKALPPATTNAAVSAAKTK